MDSVILESGLSTQFLKADGSVDTNTYLTTATAGTTYLAKTGGVMSGTIDATAFIRSGGMSSQFLKADGSVDSSTYLTTPTSLQEAYDIGNGTISGALSTKPFIVKNGTAEILKVDSSITLGNTISNATPIAITGNLTITSSDKVIPLKRPDNPALVINNWTSGYNSNPSTVGLQITAVKTIVISAVGCKTGVLVAAGNFRNFRIYNSTGLAVGGPYQINKTALDPTGAFVKYSISPLTLPAGIYYLAMTLNTGDFLNTSIVATSYTSVDPSVISAFTGCYTTSADTFPNLPSSDISFTSFWVDLYASVKADSVILAGSSSIDTFEAVPLSIGAATATAINIGRAGIDVNISGAYDLPTTAPQVGQVMTCNALGTSSWATPSPSAFAALYPFTTASRTGVLTAASRTYCVTYTMAANVVLTQASIFLGSPGSDASKIGVYRGDLTTATLVGQTTSGAPTSNYYSRALTLVAGSLTFAVGDQITIVYTTSGGTTTPAYRTTTSNVALATISSNTYTGGLPATIAGILTQTATTTRICLELA